MNRLLFPSVKNAFDRQNQFDGEKYSGFIWEYCDCGVNDLRNKLISLKSSFISKIVGYFNRKYHLDLSCNNKFDGTTYHKDLSLDESIKHLCKFTSNIWQVHPFCEGNTRTTAVFMIKYLRTF